MRIKTRKVIFGITVGVAAMVFALLLSNEGGEIIVLTQSLWWPWVDQFQDKIG